jgi:hypothetical protein
LYDCPVLNDIFEAFNDTDNAVTMGTVIKAETDIFVPSVVFAVTMAVPTDTAVTNPVFDTVTAPLVEVHAIVLFVAVDGITVHDNCAVVPTISVVLVILITSPVEITVAITGTGVLLNTSVSTLPTIDPKPVQLSYPAFATYLPFDPDSISWKLLGLALYSNGFANTLQLIHAKYAAIVGAAILVPPNTYHDPFTIYATPVLGSAFAEISGVARPLALTDD